jgi:hypothetical protein
MHFYFFYLSAAPPVSAIPIGSALVIAVVLIAVTSGPRTTGLGRAKKKNYEKKYAVNECYESNKTTIAKHNNRPRL